MNINNSTDLEDIISFHCPRYNELPHLPLYKDQVIMFIEDSLKSIHFGNNEKLLTPTMVNNYVKQKVVSPPKDKRYTEEHLSYFIVVCILKQVFSLTEVCELIKLQMETCPLDMAYDQFCDELESAIKITFTSRDFSELNSKEDTSKEKEILRSSVISFANKLYIQKYIIEKCL